MSVMHEIKKVRESHFFKHNRTQLIILTVLLVLMLILSYSSDVFLTFDNISNLLRSTSIYGVIAIGMTFVILTGGIDLSVGSVVGLSSIICTMLLKAGVPNMWAVSIAIFASMLSGTLNGMVIHFGRVAPFIATLGTMAIIRGVVKLISGAKMITGLNEQFKQFAISNFFGLPNLFWVWVFTILGAWFLLNKTIFGRNVYAIGSNIEAVRLSGVKIGLSIVSVYSISSLLSGIAGVMLASRLASGLPLAGIGYELDAIAATVVGGASLFGAVGSVIGTALGSILIATIRNGGILLGINPFVLEILVGMLIVIAVMMAKERK